MRTKGAELRAEFERAKMAEASLEDTGVPSYDDVKAKIGDQLARAEAEAELAEADSTSAIDSATAMVEQAAVDAKAAAKLAEIRSSMGIASPEPEADAMDEGADEA